MTTPTYPAEFHCPICKKNYRNGFSTTSGRQEWVCPECRAKLKHKTERFKGTVKGSYVQRSKWVDGYTEISGECTVCEQFPCEHTHDILHNLGMFSEPLELVRKSQGTKTSDLIYISASKLRKIRRMYGHLLEIGCRGWTDIMIQRVLDGDPDPDVPSLEEVSAWREEAEKQKEKTKR